MSKATTKFLNLLNSDDKENKPLVSNLKFPQKRPDGVTPALESAKKTKPRVKWAANVKLKNFWKKPTNRDIINIQTKAMAACNAPCKSILKKTVKKDLGELHHD